MVGGKKRELTHSGRASILNSLQESFYSRTKWNFRCSQKGGYWETVPEDTLQVKTGAKSFTKPLWFWFTPFIQNQKLRHAEVNSALKITHILPGPVTYVLVILLLEWNACVFLSFWSWLNIFKKSNKKNISIKGKFP